MEYCIAWWNVENFFASAGDPQRPEWLAKKLKSELKGWTQTIVNKKATQLAAIIRQINEGQGPDILGVCEVENESVLRLLVEKLGPLGRNYDVAHHDMQDQRGIDVAFIYDADLFETTPDQWFNHVVLKRNATRDIFQANFTTKLRGNTLVCIGNHWPARMGGGELATEPYRIIAAETLSYWIERIVDKLGTDEGDPAILVMGDFNDEPIDRSMIEYALAERTSHRAKSKRSRKPYLYNLMWPFLAENIGTHHYGGEFTLLDQVLVNRGLLRRELPMRLIGASITIHRIPEMTKAGKPRRFGRPSSSFDETGFSDHFPISVRIHEKDD
jgi:endonuclease/exonuclease/phosphatase family metal-dependent hydrolase